MSKGGPVPKGCLLGTPKPVPWGLPLVAASLHGHPLSIFRPLSPEVYLVSDKLYKSLSGSQTRPSLPGCLEAPGPADPACAQVLVEAVPQRKEHQPHPQDPVILLSSACLGPAAVSQELFITADWLLKAENSLPSHGDI